MPTILVYEFIDNPITNALILIKPSTGGLVFSCFGQSKTNMLRNAKQYVSKISNKNEQYLLRSKDFLKEKQLKFLENLCRDFEYLLSGGISSDIKCEYLLGTEFQRKVWDSAKAITRGTTLTYKGLAHKMGNPTATRAVAAALASNNIALVVPCHRVLGSNGSMTGYRWGVHIKRQILEGERRN